MNILLSLIFGGLLVRTTLWHIRSWQLREYRTDRMRAWLNTEDGRHSLWSVWFFSGVLPRPVWTLRTGVITGVILCLCGLVSLSLSRLDVPLWLIFFVLDRFAWLAVLAGVWISGGLAYYKKKQLFAAAKKIVSAAEQLTIIGITGSYGKSSTKTILVHLLQSLYGKDQVLFTPENQNTEVAIARLIHSHHTFFTRTDSRFFVVEAGAYALGEIATVCDMAPPQIAMLTGLNPQHLDLFGSYENLQKAKSELPAAATERIYFNAHNADLRRMMETGAWPVPTTGVMVDAVTDVQLTATTFTVDGSAFVLPWTGTHFTENATLALRVLFDLGAKVSELQSALKTLPPNNRSLVCTQSKQGFTVLSDTYSANLNGVLSGIETLRQYTGKKVMIMVPLRELGIETTAAHRAVFSAAKAANVQVLWAKPDDFTVGKAMLEEKIQMLTRSTFHSCTKDLGENDAVLFVSRVPLWVMKACV